MANGISIKLHNGTTPLANQTGLKVWFWETKDGGKSGDAIGLLGDGTTNATGDLIFDITRVSEMTVGEIGYLIVRKEMGTPQEALVFQGQVTVADVGVGQTYLETNFDWTRPTDWLTLTGLPTGGDNKVVLLFAVFERGPNFISLKFAAVGGYTVDWGDGSAPENITANTQGSHSYLWDDVSPATLTSEGYRQVQITITATTGSPITLVDFAEKHPSQNSGASNVAVLEFYIDTPGATSVSFSTASQNFYICESFILWPHSTASTGPLVRNMYRLKYVQIDTTGCTSVAGLYQGCTSLVALPWMDLSNCTTLAQLALTCNSLRSIPCSLDTSKSTSFLTSFSGCNSLKKAPFFDTSKATDVSSMFNSCADLEKVPFYDFSLAQNITSLFATASSLTNLPNFNFASVTNATSLLSSCFNIKNIPAWNIPSGATLTTMFTNCNSIQSMDITGMGQNLTIPACNISATEMNNVFTRLATVTAKTITITGNTYAITGAGYDPTIATAKGWTVTA